MTEPLNPLPLILGALDRDYASFVRNSEAEQDAPIRVSISRPLWNRLEKPNKITITLSVDD